MISVSATVPGLIRMACALAVVVVSALAARAGALPSSPDARYQVVAELAADDFTQGLAAWRVELAEPGRVEASNGVLVIDVPAGCTLWYSAAIEGPVLIRYEATAVARGGPNDRVSDLNCFWMATDSRSPSDLFATRRHGLFSDYDALRCYYVGVGGNGNTTTRFRRYVGEPGNRPLLPEHDLGGPDNLLVANQPQQIEILAAGEDIAFFRGGRRLFLHRDSSPYTRGHFAIRTVKSHLEIRRFRVYRLEAVAESAASVRSR